MCSNHTVDMTAKGSSNNLTWREIFFNAIGQTSSAQNAVKIHTIINVPPAMFSAP